MNGIKFIVKKNHMRLIKKTILLLFCLHGNSFVYLSNDARVSLHSALLCHLFTCRARWPQICRAAPKNSWQSNSRNSNINLQSSCDTLIGVVVMQNCNKQLQFCQSLSVLQPSSQNPTRRLQVLVYIWLDYHLTLVKKIFTLRTACVMKINTLLSDNEIKEEKKIFIGGPPVEWLPCIKYNIT